MDRALDVGSVFHSWNRDLSALLQTGARAIQNRRFLAGVNGHIP